MYLHLSVIFQADTPWADTPSRHPAIDNPFQAEIPWADTPQAENPPPWPLQQMVRILLECFLVWHRFFAKNCMEMKLDLGWASQQIHQWMVNKDARILGVEISFPETSMHSSRMSTAHLLPVSPSMHCGRGRSSPGGMSTPGGCLLLGVFASGGLLPGGAASGPWGVCLWSGGEVSQHALGQTTPCEQNDWQTGVKTLPSFEGGKNRQICSNIEFYYWQLVPWFQWQRFLKYVSGPFQMLSKISTRQKRATLFSLFLLQEEPCW